MKVLILAGGFAKRLWPLTTNKAKPLLPLAGRPVVSHIVEKIPADFPIVISTNKTFAPDFEAWRARHPEHDISIFVEDAASEATKKGALAAIALAISSLSIDEDLVVVGGDNFFTFNIQEFLLRAGTEPMLAAYDIGDLDAAKKYGVVVADGDRVLGFEEKPEAPRSTLVSTCCYYFPRHTLTQVTEAAALMPDKVGWVFEYLLSQGLTTRVFTFTGYWNDIGSFQGYLDAHRAAGLETGIPEKFLDPALGNTFEGVNHIDERCEIRGAHVRDSIVLADCVLEDCLVHSCIMDAGCAVRGERIEGRIISRNA